VVGRVPVLQRLAHVLALDALGARQIGDRAGDPERPRVTAGRQAHRGVGPLEHRPGAGREVLGTRLRSSSRRSPAAGGRHALPHGPRRLARGASDQIVVRHGGDRDVQVDSVEERAAQPVPVAAEVDRRAAARLDVAAVVAARTSLRCLFAISYCAPPGSIFWGPNLTRSLAVSAGIARSWG